MSAEGVKENPDHWIRIGILREQNKIAYGEAKAGTAEATRARATIALGPNMMMCGKLRDGIRICRGVVKRE